MATELRSIKEAILIIEFLIIIFLIIVVLIIIITNTNINGTPNTKSLRIAVGAEDSSRA